MPDMREEFEVWADRKYSWVAQEPEHNTLSSWNGYAYENRVVQGMWESWQASRAALKVELPPERDEMFGNSAASEHQATKNQGFNDCLERVTEALQQAGIEVVK